MATIIPTTTNTSNTPVAAAVPYTPGQGHDDLLVAQPASTGLRRRNVSSQGERKSNDSEEEEVGADDYATQHDLFGPISQALLVDPVRIQGDASPGAFERKYITRWLNDHRTSPTTRAPATVADLVPAHDIQQKIRVMVRRYPNAPIVRDWLREQPTWYTQAIQRVRQFGAPAVQAMTRAVDPIRRNMPSADNCKRCCATAAEAGAGAVVGAGVGACMGCSCAIGLSGRSQRLHDLVRRQAMVSFLTPPAAIVGAAVGAVYPKECLRCADEACQAACRDNHYGGKRKTRKCKKKRLKTRKRKRKITVKRKRKKKRKKSRRRRKK